MSACSNGNGTWSPVASSSGTKGYPWGTTPWFLGVPVCPHNLSTHAIDVPAKWSLGRLCLPVKYLWWSTQPGLLQRPNTQHKRDRVLEALDIQGLKEWPESEQKQARELLLKWEHLFTHSNLDLGKTALTKHKIMLTDQMPFKEHYRCIPPHMYDNVRAHIHEMLDISAIH